jgi:hypothetical protein
VTSRLGTGKSLTFFTVCMLPTNVTDINNNQVADAVKTYVPWSNLVAGGADTGEKTTLCYLCQRQQFFWWWNKSSFLTVCSSGAASLAKFFNVNFSLPLFNDSENFEKRLKLAKCR